ncbi:MAG: dipeptide epimerase [Parasphingorhabdus sp.]
MNRQISIVEEKWLLKKPFVIARSSRTTTSTIKVTICDGFHKGIGECVPNSRYEESVESSIQQIRAVESQVIDGASRNELRKIMRACAARNAIDCALWDLEAKQVGQDVGVTSGLGWPQNIETVQTISILSPEKMHREAKMLRKFPVIKIKMNSEQVLERMAAVHAGAPNSKFLIDANESWTIELLKNVSPALVDLNVQMIEQPLHADDDSALQDHPFKLPIFADESCHSTTDLEALQNKYQGINIKLDKSGGLTEAIALKEAAETLGLQTMVGCMLSTSLGIAPATFIAKEARFVDIDAPALLEKDRLYGIQISNGKTSSLDPRLWGGIEKTITRSQ